MGSGCPGASLVLLAGAADLTRNPYIVFGAAAFVVIAVLIVLILILRGAKKAQSAPELDDGQASWESAPRSAASQMGKDYSQQDQMFPWQGGGARADAGRQMAGGRRGLAGREAQTGWDQPDGYAQHDAQWDAPAPSGGRGGQWSGVDDWGGSPEPAMDRSGGQRASQDQPGAPASGWGWGAAQAASSGQSEWGRGPAASPAQGREQDLWGQSASARGHDEGQWNQPAQGQWGQSAQDQWGQPAQGQWNQPAQGQWGQSAQDQWGRTSQPRGWEQDQWGQNAPMQGRDEGQWGQPAQPGGREQMPWSQSSSAARGMAHADELAAGSRGGPPREAEAAGQMDGQWGQGSWGASGSGWEGAGAADRWGQPVQSGGASHPVSPATSRPGSPRSQPLAGDAGSAWGASHFDQPAASNQFSGGWEQRGQSWQPAKPQEPPAWQGAGWNAAEPEPMAPRSGQRNQPPSSAQWGQPGHSLAKDAWEPSGAAGEWGQPAQSPQPSASRPIAPAGSPSTSYPPASGSASGMWGERGAEGPAMRSAPPAGREQQEAPAWSSAQEPATPGWQQPPAAQMAAASPASAPPERRGPDLRQISKVGPESTAYAPPAPDNEPSEADKTVVMRKDTASEGVPAIVVRQGKEPGRTYEMRKEQISIGRSRDSDIFLEDLAVSRLHATIYRDEMGGYRLRDEHSANGTSVNGQRITETTLQEGDEIQLGQTILAFMRR